MADALVSFLIEQLGSVFRQEIEQEVRLVVGVDKEVEKLVKTFQLIQAVLNDAEQRQIKEEPVKLWLKDFKELAYEMDDVLDEWRTEILRSQLESERDDDEHKITNKKVSSYLCSPFSCFNKVAFRHDIGSRIKNIRERLDFIETEKHKFQFVQSSMTISEGGCSKRPETTSIINVSDISGRDPDKNIILSKLLGESEVESHPYIISIVGMGGLGKTTLAQLVFNDDQVKTHFKDITVWVSVNESFDLTKIAKEIIKKSGRSISDFIDWNDDLHQTLCDSVKGKRFLIVLDDVSNEDPNKWNPLKLSLKCGAPGSRVLVTTRNEKVSLRMGTTYKHELGILSDNDCSLLLCRMAFVGKKEEDHQDLKEIGFEIAKKCKGLPIAAKTLGSLLQFKKTKKDWRVVLESKIWELKESDHKNNVLNPALLLGYDDLSSPLKNCFAFCSILPKGDLIFKYTLIKFWMAEGLLGQTGIEELESIGEDYFNELVMRSFLQKIKDFRNERVSICEMHDLVHDLAQFLTHNECSIAHDRNIDLLKYNGKPLHLTLKYGHHEGEVSSFRTLIPKVKKLRTLLFSPVRWDLLMIDAPSIDDLFHQLRSLRVLILGRIGLESLPSEIEKLLHLRYLDLSYSDNLKELPDSISRLYNLQTLILNWCTNLQKLPRGMGRMVNLSHLEIEDTYSLTYLPKGIGKLSSLRTLSKFIVGGASGGCKIEELKDLNLLQGSLEISGLGRLETVTEATKAELNKKQDLYKLSLAFYPREALGASVQVEERMETMLEILQPHPNLLCLNIGFYLGFKFPSWLETNSVLTRLKSLRLYDCSNFTELSALELLTSLETLVIRNLDKLKILPALGKLPFLARLQIQGARKVTRLGCEFYGIDSTPNRGVNLSAFPKLEWLELTGMQMLEEWDLSVVLEGEGSGGEIMPCVSHITLVCEKLKALPALGKLPSLVSLKMAKIGEVTQVCSEFYGIDSVILGGGGQHVNKTAFPELKVLIMSTMQNLEVLHLGEVEEQEEERSNGGKVIVMPCIEALVIRSSPKLKTLRLVTKLLPSLKHLVLVELDNLEEIIAEVEEREADSSNMLPELLYLHVEGCPKLKSVPRHLPKLNDLFISGCSLLRQFPVVPNLETLEIISSPLLSPLPNLPNLTTSETSFSSSYENHEPNKVLMELRISRAWDLFKTLNTSTFLSELQSIFPGSLKIQEE